MRKMVSIVHGKQKVFICKTFVSALNKYFAYWIPHCINKNLPPSSFHATKAFQSNVKSEILAIQSDKAKIICKIFISLYKTNRFFEDQGLSIGKLSIPHIIKIIKTLNF